MQRIRRALKKLLPQKGSVLKQWFLSYLLVLVLPILVLIASSYSVRNIVTDEIVQANEAALVTLQASIDSQLYQGQLVVSNLLVDQRLRDVIRQSNSQQQIVETQGDLIGLLWNYTSAIPGIDILVYIRDIDYVVTPRTAQPLSYLSRNISHSNHVNIPEGEWRDLLLNTDNNYRYTSSSQHSYLQYGNEALVYSADNNQAIFSNCHYTQLFVSLQYSSIAGLLDVPDGSAIVVLDEYGEQLACFGEPLTEFLAPTLAEDEIYQVVRIGQQRYIYTHRYSEATGLTCAMLTPYNQFWQPYHYLILLTGIFLFLALLTGLLAIVAMVRRNYRSVRSVLDLLKPEHGKPPDTSNENEFDIIREHLHRITDRHSDMESNYVKQQRLLRENYFYSVLVGNKRHLADDDIIESLQLGLEGKLFYPVSFFPVNLLDSRLAFIQASKAGEGSRSKISLPFLLDNVLGEMLGGRFPYYKVDMADTSTFVFLSSQEVFIGNRAVIHQALENLREVFSSHFLLDLKIVLGREVEQVEDLAASYKEIMAVHLYQFTAGDARIIQARQLDYRTSCHMLQLEEFSSILSEAVLYGSLDDALSVADAFFEELGSSDDRFSCARYHVFSLTSKLLGVTSQHDTAGLGALLDRIPLCQTPAELKHYLVRLIRLLCPGSRSTAGEDSRVSARVDAYVQAHFADSNLSLTAIADIMGLSVKYLSKLFKMETGQGLLDHINTVRIQGAKELLTAGTYSINDAAEQVGYTNLKTFRRAFKKVEGVNPSAYKSEVMVVSASNTE